MMAALLMSAVFLKQTEMTEIEMPLNLTTVGFKVMQTLAVSGVTEHMGLDKGLDG